MTIANGKDTIVDTVAKMLAPSDYPNWHQYRDYARNLLRPASLLKEGEIAAILADSDREITHAELHADSRARLAAYD